MGLAITKRDTELDECFPVDADQFYDILQKFMEITPENYLTAFQVSKDALSLADRWSCLMTNAGKLALSNKINKTELKDYCYRKYQTLKYIHEFLRMIWNKGEQGERGR
ncbi:MAG: hypothetical protein Q8936_01790 [Bacillota bacterium]|nr:hypothetical protein [Bacillota bacterium]